MKKKIICLILSAIMILFAFSACKNKNGENEKSTSATPTETSAPAETSAAKDSESTEETTKVETPDNPPPAALSYEIKKAEEDIEVKSKTYGTKTLLIPVVKGLESAEKDAAINALIEKDIKSKVNNSLPSAPYYNESEGLEVNYEVKAATVTYLSDYLFSAKIEGELTLSDAPHPYLYVYTVNIDIAGEKVLSSKDIIKNFNDLKKTFKEGKFSYEYGSKELLAQTNNEDMIMQYYTEYEIYPYFYFTEDKFCLNIELVYALGGNAGFSLPYKDAKNYLNTNIDAISKIIK